MSTKNVTLHDENGNVLLPATKTSRITDANGTGLDTLLQQAGQVKSISVNGVTQTIDANGNVNIASADGVGIASVVQTTTSSEDGGTNVITVTKTDNTTSTFSVKNGSKGSTGATGPQGERGPQGNTGVQVDSVASIIHSIDSTTTYAAADVAGADAVQDVLAEVTELGGEIVNQEAYVQSGYQFYSSLKWGYNASNASYYKIPVTAGTQYRITANASYSVLCVFLKTCNPSNNGSMDVCTGETYTNTLANETSAWLTAPSDANYLAVQKRSYSNNAWVDKSPASIEILILHSLKDSVAENTADIAQNTADIESLHLGQFITITTNSSDNISGRYIKTDGSYPSGAGSSWLVTAAIPLSDKKGMDVVYMKTYKSANDMLIYALYSTSVTSGFIANSGYVVPSSENNTIGRLEVDSLLESFSTAKYIRFTLHSSQYLQPYFEKSISSETKEIDENINGKNLESVDNTFNPGNYINANGETASYEPFYTSIKNTLSVLVGYIYTGIAPYSTTYDTRTYAVYDSSDNVLTVSEPTNSSYEGRKVYIDFDEILLQYPTATQISISSHGSDIPKAKLIKKDSILYELWLNEKEASEPSVGGLDNFTFATAGSTDIISIVSNQDTYTQDVKYDTGKVNFAQVMKIDGNYVCYYFGIQSNTTGEYNQHVLCAWSADGITWQRGFPTGVTPPVSGTNLLFDETASGYAAITEACWCQVPDKDYPYRMIGNTNTTKQYGDKRCTMWRSSDGFHYEKMGTILDNVHRDTQYSAVVRGNVIKLYCRQSDSTSYGYKRSVAISYIDINGNILTPPYKTMLQDYYYTSAAHVLDDKRELLIPTWYNGDLQSAPATQNAHLETYIFEGDKIRKIDTNINECLAETTGWMSVSPAFVTINKGQYIVVNESNATHNGTSTLSTIKLVKVTRS